MKASLISCKGFLLSKKRNYCHGPDFFLNNVSVRWHKYENSQTVNIFQTVKNPERIITDTNKTKTHSTFLYPTQRVFSGSGQSFIQKSMELCVKMALVVWELDTMHYCYVSYEPYGLCFSVWKFYSPLTITQLWSIVTNLTVTTSYRAICHASPGGIEVLTMLFCSYSLESETIRGSSL